MPQMAPLWWEMLYIIVSIMMMMTSITIYHNKTMKSLKSTQPFTTSLTKKYWSW
uniref:ATP synthase F0 subunit 8 n=1 Tax=Melamphaus rubrocinctus TaxID=238647 RepID=A0A4Y1JVU7_9HEMI|nr:ATP synthase F0 subunit 8 [Melamphaus rubrocinctus]APO08861.1 ATP synthase F0 subunit 8 [Melamphaus rubrocinctus]